MPHHIAPLTLTKRLFEDVAICEHSGGLKGVSSRGGFIKDGTFSAVVLTNLTGVDCSPILNAAFNMRLGLPVDASHEWAQTAEDLVGTPSVYTGRYTSQEDFGAQIVIKCDELGRLFWEENGEEFPVIFCGGTVFKLMLKGKKQGIPMTFYVRNNRAWGVQFGMRIFQREEKPES